VRCENGRIVQRVVRLIRPPRQNVVFTYIHGLTWQHVEKAPPFAVVWSELEGLLDGAEFLAAHNASFDPRRADGLLRGRAPAAPRAKIRLHRAARAARLEYPATKLPNVCARLNIELNHHEALSDAEACAKIVLRRARSRDRRRVRFFLLACGLASAAVTGKWVDLSQPAEPAALSKPKPSLSFVHPATFERVWKLLLPPSAKAPPSTPSRSTGSKGPPSSSTPCPGARLGATARCGARICSISSACADAFPRGALVMIKTGVSRYWGDRARYLGFDDDKKIKNPTIRDFIPPPPSGSRKTASPRSSSSTRRPSISAPRSFTRRTEFFLLKISP